MKVKSLNAITLGGIFAAIYTVITIISVYIFPLIGVIGLLILPIFSAYYSSLYNFKETLIFNIATLFTCFIVGIADPFYAILYVLPTLVVGDVFGILNRLKIKYYTTIFLQTLSYSIINIITLYLSEKLYELEIVKFIISDSYIYENFSLSILFVLSGAEAIFSSMFISEKLQLLNIKKDKETSFPFYGYLAYLIFTFLSVGLYFVSYNFYYLIICVMISISYPILKEFISKIKHKQPIIITYILLTASISFYFCYLDYFNIIPLIILSPLIIYCLVKMCVYIYNIRRK